MDTKEKAENAILALASEEARAERMEFLKQHLTDSLFSYSRWLYFESDLNPLTIGREQGYICAAATVLLENIDVQIYKKFLEHEKSISNDTGFNNKKD